MVNNTGSYSTGDWSTGDWSTGDNSTGDWSAGSYSTGYHSTGDYSTGCSSTGSYSTGDYSTGCWSTGYRSTGNWSTGERSTGHFSTIDYAGFGAFNKPCTPEEWLNAVKPRFIYFSLTEWVELKDMTDKEKKDNPTWKTTGGYLKVYRYQEAWRIAWDTATDGDRKLLYALPNFDAEVFKEISGIDVNEKHTIVIDGKEIELSEESFNELKKSLLADN